MISDPFCDGPLRLAVRHLFNGDLKTSQSLLAQYVCEAPGDPLGYSLSAAVPFYNFVGDTMRLQYGNSLRGIILGKGIRFPPGLRQNLGYHLQCAQRHARLDLAANPNDTNAAFALCVAEGVERDVMALVFKKWMVSFRHAQDAALHARRLLGLNPAAYDAYFVIGFSEHLIQEIPAIFRPFTKIPGIVGETSRAIAFLEAAASGGHYFQEFARQMLFTLYTEEGREHEALTILSQLVTDFPGNGGYRAEWARRGLVSQRS
jgi:hypothetical protein